MTFRRLAATVRGLFTRAQSADDLQEEIRAHLAMEEQENRDAGMSRDEARYAALRRFGNVALAQEKTREMWGWTWLDNLAQDVRYGFRQLRRSPGFTLVAVLALALGIGANTAVFSVFYGVLIRPLPYPEPGRLIWLWPEDMKTGRLFGGAISPPDFRDYRERSTSFDHLAAFMALDTTLTGNGEADRVSAATVSAGFFETLGVQPALGRTILSDDEQVAQPQAVILGYGLWQSRYGGDPQILGKTASVDGRPMTIVGVMPPGFEFPQGAQLWNAMPMKMDEMQVRRFHFIRAIGRLKQGVTLAQADAQMLSICQALEKLYPDTNRDYGVKPVLLQDRLVGDLRPALRVLMTAVALVLLIACVNVAQLLLARSSVRQREMAIRTSLGASNGRLARQLLTESILLGLLGGALGVIVAFGALQALAAINPANLPRLNQVHLDFRALAFTAALSILTGVIFGLAPARAVSSGKASGTLKEGGRGITAGRSHQRLHHILVSAEVALSLVLLIGASLMIRSFVQLHNVKPGFDPSGVVTFQASLPRFDTSSTDMNRGEVFFEKLLARLRAEPEVESAAVVSELPLSGQENDTYFAIEGRPTLPNRRPDEDNREISPDYFKTMGIPMIAGRAFTDSDNQHAPKVAIVSEDFARTYFPNENAIGHHLVIDFGISFNAEIVGIVGDVHHHAMATPPDLIMYVPFAQAVESRGNVVIRARTSGLGLISAIRRDVQALDPNVPVYGVHSMEELVSESASTTRFQTLLLGTFAIIALVLATAGIYGVVSYWVSQRTHEIGVRLALGASRRAVIGMVLGQETMWALGGVTAGIGAALGLGRFIVSLLYDVRPVDPLCFATVPIVLLVVTVVASYIPARRASRVDPMTALRCE